MATTYEQLLAQQSASIDSNILEQLDIAEITNNKIEALYNQISLITGKEVYEDYYYKSGKIIGVLRHIQQNPKCRRALLELTGLNSAILDLYNTSSGAIPYINKETGLLIEGKPQNVELFIQTILLTATKLGIVLPENYLDDITEERFQRRYNKALDECQQTQKFKPKTKIVYDE